ncbi:MAG TPA: hypothetical protein DIS97_16620 [Citrobacter freundii]|nr:hypothetical protein [Citrobacter freundii]
MPLQVQNPEAGSFFTAVSAEVSTPISFSFAAASVSISTSSLLLAASPEKLTASKVKAIKFFMKIPLKRKSKDNTHLL